MPINTASGNLATSFRKTVYGSTWTDSRAYQVCSLVVTAYGSVPLVFSVGTKFVNGSDDFPYQYRVLARSVTLQPGQTYRLDGIMTVYNQQLYARQISGDGIAYVSATPTPVSTASYVPTAIPMGTQVQPLAGQSALYYMADTTRMAGVFDIVVGNVSGSPTISVAIGPNANNPAGQQFIRRDSPVRVDRPNIIRKAIIKPTDYINVQVLGGNCDVAILGFGLTKD